MNGYIPFVAACFVICGKIRKLYFAAWNIFRIFANEIVTFIYKILLL